MVVAAAYTPMIAARADEGRLKEKDTGPHACQARRDAYSLGGASR